MAKKFEQSLIQKESKLIEEEQKKALEGRKNRVVDDELSKFTKKKYNNNYFLKIDLKKNNRKNIWKKNRTWKRSNSTINATSNKSGRIWKAR